MAKDKVKIILVEDHDIFRKHLKDFIEMLGCCEIIAEAADGMEAIDVINKKPADLIILDLSLPRMSGLAVIKEAKKVSTAKILAITVLAELNIAQQAMDEGADGFFLKDMSLKTFEKAILETLDGKQPVYTVEE